METSKQEKLSKKQLAEALGMSSTTLWRCLNSAQANAKKFKLEKLPVHSNYPGGRKYFYLVEVQNWLNKVFKYSNE
jgi:predicted DNA-binding transcriptional regulator AlpA